MQHLAIWSDGTWCDVEDLHEYSWMSDDYTIEEVPEGLTDEEFMETRSEA